MLVTKLVRPLIWLITQGFWPSFPYTNSFLWHKCILNGCCLVHQIILIKEFQIFKAVNMCHIWIFTFKYAKIFIRNSHLWKAHSAARNQWTRAHRDLQQLENTNRVFTGKTLLAEYKMHADYLICFHNLRLSFKDV